MSSMWMDYAEDAADCITRVSRWIDMAPANVARDREAATWGRLAKIQEEAGEVIAAFIAYTGQNPRKPQKVDGLNEVARELLDVALTALAAYEHLTGHHGIALADLFRHARNVHARTAASDYVADVGRRVNAAMDIAAVPFEVAAPVRPDPNRPGYNPAGRRMVRDNPQA